MKNLVFIQTFNRFGSGVLFPCKYGKKDTCLILTNYHVIRDLKADGEDKKEYINLEFYDIFGKKVGKEFIRAVYVEYGAVCDNESDIAVLLVEIDDAVCLSSDFGEEILWQEPEEGTICSVGYPNVLQEDDINHRLIIEGKIENTFPPMKKMGIYKITDNYHWYERMSDRDLFEGFSGGPVYMQADQKKILIGINQSLCNTGDGNNPFKLVYFIRISQAFEFLRECGIILYEYNDGKIEIEWTKGQAAPGFDENGRNVDIMLLGGSGSGKSSFVKELMLHGDVVNASGDGQTTRMDAVYQLEVCCKEPKMEVKFYNKEEFPAKMVELTSINRITYILQSKFYFPHRNLDEDMFAYLRMVFQPLEALMKIVEETLPEKVTEENSIMVRIREAVAEINSSIRKGDDAEKEEIIKVYQDVLKLFEKICISKDLHISPKQVGAIFRVDWEENYRKNMQKEVNNKSANQCSVSLDNYIKYILSLKDEEIDKYCYRADESQKIFDVLNTCKGFFDIREFYFLFERDEPERYFENLVKEYENSFDENAVEENTEWEYEESHETDSKLKLYYKTLYEDIYSRFQNYFEIRNNHDLVIELSETNEKEREIITLCLKVTSGKSLTGMIKQINIVDNISNNYVLMLKRCGIQRIKLIDTCGLDHIERGTGIKRLLQEKFSAYNEAGVKLDAVFYLKKLDAGRPAELERILPILYNIAPDQPIFNIFTGADIFYGGREEYLIDFPWSEQLYDMEKKDERMRLPKSVAYFYKNQNVVKRIPCSEERQKDLYRVIKENLMPFVSDTEKRKYKKFAKSNRTYLKKVLESILFDQWNSGYIDQKRIIAMLQDQKVIHALDEDIVNMLGAASLFDWNFRHHMTVNANIRRIFGKVKKEEYMGFNGVSFDRWDYLLKEGFQTAFLENKSEVIHVFSEQEISKNQLERMFGKLKNRIINEDMKYNQDYCPKGSKFREIFIKMYKDRECFDHNPYNIDSELKLEGQKEKREYLKDICEFQKGLKNIEIKNDFRKLFIEEIRNYAEAENKRHLVNLWQYKSDFREKVNEVINEMKIIAGTDDDNILREMFDIFLDLSKDRRGM